MNTQLTFEFGGVEESGLKMDLQGSWSHTEYTLVLIFKGYFGELKISKHKVLQKNNSRKKLLSGENLNFALDNFYIYLRNTASKQSLYATSYRVKLWGFYLPC